jgi:hypothetical protein
MIDYRQLRAADDFGVFRDGAYLGTVTKTESGWVAINTDGKVVGDQHGSREAAGEALMHDT